MAVGKPTQDFVPIKEVREGIVVLKDGGLRSILLATSVNLSLKSADEQVAIIMQFQNFLNSLEFTTQIVVQSRRRDMRPYLATLEERMKEQLEPLLKIQTKEYIEFIRTFTNETNIMEKSFFVVVPYTPTVFGPSNKGMSSMLPSFGKKTEAVQAEDKNAKFEEGRSQLEQRMAVISQGLSRIGVRTASLGTEEIIELFYKIFNPGEASTAAQKA